MRKFFIEYFNYSAKELRPLYYLIILLLLSIIIRSTLSSSPSKEYLPGPELLKKNHAFVAQLRIQEPIAKKENDSQKILMTDPFFFDPNTIEIAQLKKFGFNEKILSNISKYRKAGGKFFQPQDMKIIYGMSEDIYQEIEKWIVIITPDSENELPQTLIDSQSIIDYQKDIDLNKLLYKDLLQITGGNTKMTGRILNYKNLLGGYYSIKQLMEVYEMNDSLYNLILHAVEIDTMQIEGLSINSSGYSDLLRHPYLDKTQVNLIMKYRAYKDSHIDIKEFIEGQILPDSTISKMRPYLTN